MKDFVTSFIRSVVPAIVATVGAFLAARGIHIDDTGMAGLTAALTGLFYATYYSVIRLFEIHVSPKFGWLLGYAKMPVYTVKPNLGTDTL